MHRPLPQSERPRIEDAIRRGEMIEAIKLHREATDSSLIEAKDAVDAMAADLRGMPGGVKPGDPSDSPTAHRTGCLTVLVAVTAVGGTLLAGISW